MGVLTRTRRIAMDVKMTVRENTSTSNANDNPRITPSLRPLIFSRVRFSFTMHQREELAKYLHRESWEQDADYCNGIN